MRLDRQLSYGQYVVFSNMPNQNSQVLQQVSLVLEVVVALVLLRRTVIVLSACCYTLENQD
ncbi:MAG: hypothetical protein ACFC03_02690 [Candidatus Malihini olakiniferum]